MLISVCVCVCVCVYARARVCVSCSVVSDSFYDPMDCSPPGSSVFGILQARILEWVAFPFSRGSSWPRDWTRISCVEGKFCTIWATREASLWHICFPTSGMSSTHLIGLTTFSYPSALSPQRSLSSLSSSHRCPTSWAKLGILSPASRGSLIIPFVLCYNSLFIYVLIDCELGAWTSSYSSLYTFAHNSTWCIVDGQ